VNGHILLKGCTIEADTPKTQKHENCFRVYSKKLDKSFYFQASDYTEMLQWIQAIKDASESVVSTKNVVPAVTAKPMGDGEHSLLMNEEEMPTHTSDRSQTMTLSALSRPLTVDTTPAGSERSTFVKDGTSDSE